MKTLIRKISPKDTRSLLRYPLLLSIDEDNFVVERSDVPMSLLVEIGRVSFPLKHGCWIGKRLNLIWEDLDVSGKCKCEGHHVRAFPEGQYKLVNESAYPVAQIMSDKSVILTAETESLLLDFPYGVHLISQISGELIYQSREWKRKQYGENS